MAFDNIRTCRAKHMHPGSAWRGGMQGPAALCLRAPWPAAARRLTLAHKVQGADIMAIFPLSILPTVSDRLAVLPQYLMPKRALTVAAGRIASARAGALTTALIRRFVARYGVDMTEAANPDPASYNRLNE